MIFLKLSLLCSSEFGVDGKLSDSGKLGDSGESGDFSDTGDSGAKLQFIWH